MKQLLLIFSIFWTFHPLAYAVDKPVIRIGSMAAGTLNWELEIIKQNAKEQDYPFSIETVSLANQQAGKIALLGNSVDLIISDWIWVSSMRAEGKDLAFYPYSNSAGGLMVPIQSNINNLSDLKGKKLGIAGGELDKNWILLLALAAQQGIDLNQSTEKVFGAPPILNQQILNQKLDAVLTFWQFAAQLEPKGFRQLLSGEEMIRQLGIPETVPSLGYVFHTGWGKTHLAEFKAFLATAKSARNALCESEAVWKKVSTLSDSQDASTDHAMWQRYCDGRIQQWSKSHQDAAAKIFSIISQQTDSKLTEKTKSLETGTFWSVD
jgi:NitT/TauT family transport system substrate-binding protein